MQKYNTAVDLKLLWCKKWYISYPWWHHQIMSSWHILRHIIK